jgi:hypothetical protein
VDADIKLARITALNRQPIDEFGIGRAAQPFEQRLPRGEQINPPAKRMPRPFDPRAAGAIEPIGRFGQQRLKPYAQTDQRAA